MKSRWWFCGGAGPSPTTAVLVVPLLLLLLLLFLSASAAQTDSFDFSSPSSSSSFSSSSYYSTLPRTGSSLRRHVVPLHHDHASEVGVVLGSGRRGGSPARLRPTPPPFDSSLPNVQSTARLKEGCDKVLAPCTPLNGANKFIPFAFFLLFRPPTPHSLFVFIFSFLSAGHVVWWGGRADTENRELLMEFYHATGGPTTWLKRCHTGDATCWGSDSTTLQHP